MIFPEAPDHGHTRIKICGVAHPDDAALAIELGADALGLNFYPGSPRCLSLERDEAWLRALPAGVRRIAVVVNAPLTQIERLLGEGIVHAVQIHGDEDEAFCHALQAARLPFIKAIRVRDEQSLRAPERFGADHLLLDAYRPDTYGGTGHTLDWTLAARFVEAHRSTMLSGGLHAGNVAEAIRQVRPFAVDVASGIEGAAGPRRKDAAKMRDFIVAARAAGENASTS